MQAHLKWAPAMPVTQQVRSGCRPGQLPPLPRLGTSVRAGEEQQWEAARDTAK